MNAIVLYDFERDAALLESVWGMPIEIFHAHRYIERLARFVGDDVLLDWLHSDNYKRQIIAVWCMASTRSRRFYAALWEWRDDSAIGDDVNEALGVLNPQYNPIAPAIIYAAPPAPRKPIQLSLFEAVA